jgi:hypothetical protein
MFGDRRHMAVIGSDDCSPTPNLAASYCQWPAIQTQPPGRRTQWPATQTAAGLGRVTQLPGTQT